MSACVFITTCRLGLFQNNNILCVPDDVTLRHGRLRAAVTEIWRIALSRRACAAGDRFRATFLRDHGLQRPDIQAALLRERSASHGICVSQI